MRNTSFTAKKIKSMRKIILFGEKTQAWNCFSNFGCLAKTIQDKHC